MAAWNLILYNALFSRSINSAILSFENFAGFTFREFVAATTLLNVFGKTGLTTQLHSF